MKARQSYRRWTVNDILGLIRSAGAARIAAIIGVTMGVALALGLIVARIGEPPLAILYADLDLRDAQAVSQRLDQMGVRYHIRERGGSASILAPRDEAARLKLSLAADGVVRSSGVGYEIFDGESAFGSTSFQQNINRLRALEGELARTIASISGVRAARVHLVLPERELFARERKAASASIVVDAPSGLDQRSVRAIVNLAATAVPELAPERVTVLDASGALLASGQTDSSVAATAADERITATETRLRRTVEDLVGRIVGEENLRVQVAAEMDFNRVTENAEIIDPNSQTVLSSTSIEETSDASEPSLGRGVTVANALPGAQQAALQGAANTSTTRRTQETTNYEISRTVRSEVREQGSVKRLSVAVAINQADAPRGAQELARIDALVKSAVGYSQARGDRVEIVEIRFQPDAAPVSAQGVTARSPALSQDQSMRLAEVGALGLIGLALIYFVLRPMLSAPASTLQHRADNDGVTALISQSAPRPLPAPNRAFEEKLDLARVEGQVKASSLNKVSEVVRGHADESAGILKNWIRQAS